MVLYKKIEKDGEQAIYEELKVLPSYPVIILGAAYNHLVSMCPTITPEVAVRLLALLDYEAPLSLYGVVAMEDAPISGGNNE